MVPNDDLNKIAVEDEADESAEPMDIDEALKQASGEGEGFGDVSEADLERQAIINEKDEEPL